MSASTTLLSRLQARDAAAADALANRLREFARTVPTEPGNLVYQIHRVQQDRTTLYIQEQWAQPEDAERHVRRVESDPDAQESSALLAGPIETVTLLRLDVTHTNNPAENDPAEDDERNAW